MSDSHQSSVAALATVFGNTMSLVDEGQGEEHSPERRRMITEAEDFLKNKALGAIVLCVNASKTCYATIAFIKISCTRVVLVGNE